MVANRGERLFILCADYSCLYLYINSTNVLQYKRTTVQTYYTRIPGALGGTYKNGQRIVCE
jgi:hypothetical protein